MTRALPIKAALVLTTGLLFTGCGKPDCTKAENMSLEECKPAKVEFAAVYAKLSGCTLAVCHGANPMPDNKLKGLTGANKVTCDVVKTLISTSAPATGRFPSYAYNSAHTGGTANTDWTKATDAGPTTVVSWITSGATCPTQ
jgi:hypothetical protein